MGKFKAAFFLMIIAIVWGYLIHLMWEFMLLALLYDKLINNKINWFYSTFLAQDHLVSVIIGEHYLTTVSSLLGYLRSLKNAGGTYAANVVDWLFKVFRNEDNHCDNAMQKDDIYHFSARRAIAGSFIFMYGIFITF